MTPRILAAVAILNFCLTAFAERRLNNLVTELISAPEVLRGAESFKFQRATDGWILISAVAKGAGVVHATLDGRELEFAPETMRFVTRGEHTLQFNVPNGAALQNLSVRAIPELMHSGLGFNPQIRGYGVYDMDFLNKDVLPNITTLIIPSSAQLEPKIIDDWHRQGKRFVAEVGINAQAKTAAEHAQFWTAFFDKTPFLDGIIVNEFIVNRPVAEWVPVMTQERLDRMAREHEDYERYGEAAEQIRAEERYRDKMLYFYVGGSGKKLNREIVGTNIFGKIMKSGYRIAPERYLHEMSSEKGSEEALRQFVEGLDDWETKEPGVKRQMIIAFGLFSMPSGGLNKQPNVDYHVWMDQQMNLVATHPSFSGGIAGFNWWTTLLADEETVRFMGRLYRHYAIDGRTDRYTHDPLFLTHVQNADFENGTNSWTLRPAETNSIATKSFPRYGRIEGRFMGLGRPADPEHIGDTFLWMKRSSKGPNTFSQTIKDLEPGRLYSMKMFSCDYQDLANPKAKKQEEATGFIGNVSIEGVEIDEHRSFTETYSSNPEPKIPVWITYHWKVFRAKAKTATFQASDWPAHAEQNPKTFGQEQAFNFLEIQPYHE